jgi:hypothetical protein
MRMNINTCKCAGGGKADNIYVGRIVLDLDGLTTFLKYKISESNRLLLAAQVRIRTINTNGQCLSFHAQKEKDGCGE